MSECQKCKSENIINLSAKCSDMCFTTYKSFEKDGYVPHIVPLGGGDYVQITVCIECGQVQGDFPISEEDVLFEMGVEEI